MDLAPVLIAVIAVLLYLILYKLDEVSVRLQRANELLLDIQGDTQRIDLAASDISSIETEARRVRRHFVGPTGSEVPYE